MIEIHKILFFEYLAVFLGHRSAFSDRCAEGAANSSMLLCADYDGVCAGYLCAAENEYELRITYAYTMPEHRRKHIFTELVNYITGQSEKPVRVNILHHFPSFFMA